jgi:phospholipid/cholesterol/gamma-HCH transport system substrate-binding protein
VAQQRSIEVRVGLFLLVCLIVIAGLIIRFGKYERFASRAYEINVVFPNVAGIVKDASVMYAGIPVGKVKRIRLTEQGGLRVKLTLSIYEGVKIRRDAKFVINQSGLLGDRYVDVIPQSATAELLKSGDTIEGSASVDLTEAVRGVVDVLQQAAGTIAHIDNAVKRIDDVLLSQKNLDAVGASLENIQTSTAGLREIVAENRNALTNMLNNMSGAANNLSTASKRVDDFVLNNQDQIAAAAKHLSESAQRLNTILERLQQGQGTAGKILVDPTLHDELVQLVQNWRRYGLLYREGGPKRDSETARGKTPVPARPATQGTQGITFGTDATGQ